MPMADPHLDGSTVGVADQDRWALDVPSDLDAGSKKVSPRQSKIG
jgi:hypothetical protein